ncbi:Apoptosis inhibitor IAP [Nymphon striatum]|nr:Apoptosis inhibitor IAP [Nymphon striatum]
MGLKQLPKCFGIKDVAKGDFPHLFNRTENQKYVGKYPALHYYNVGRMKSPERSEFIAWYESVKDSEFDFKKELVSYCTKDVEILAKSCLKFRKLFIGASKVDPLQYITVASACMAAYKSKFCQELYDIDGKSVIVTGRQFPEGKSGTFIRSYFLYIKASVDIFSAASIRWLSWVAHTKNIKIIHACHEGEYRVPGSRYRLDGFHAETRTAYEFHSCMYHGCLFCFENRGHMVLHLNQRVEELYRLTMLKKQFLLNKGYNYVCMWFHEYDEKRQSDEVFKSFVDNLDVVERLSPLGMKLYGERTNAVRLHYKPKVDEKIEYKMKALIDDHQKYVDVPETKFVRSKKDFSIKTREANIHFPFFPFLLKLDTRNVPISVSRAHIGEDVWTRYTNPTKASINKAPNVEKNHLEQLGIHVSEPLHAAQTSLATRISSFSNCANKWPSEHLVSALSLARAGFFYKGISDCTRCFYCNISLYDWGPNDVPFFEHARWQPRCGYVEMVKGDPYIQECRLKSPPMQPKPTFSPLQTGATDPTSSKDEKRQLHTCITIEHLQDACNHTVLKGDIETIALLEEEINNLKEQKKCKICLEHEIGIIAPSIFICRKLHIYQQFLYRTHTVLYLVYMSNRNQPEQGGLALQLMSNHIQMTLAFQTPYEIGWHPLREVYKCRSGSTCCFHKE